MWRIRKILTLTSSYFIEFFRLGKKTKTWVKSKTILTFALLLQQCIIVVQLPNLWHNIKDNHCMKTKNLFCLIVLVGSPSSISFLIAGKQKHVVEETAHFMASGKKREMDVEGSQHLPQGNFPNNLTSIRILILEIPWHSQEHHKVDVYRQLESKV